ncbi:uncharacterized protein LAESUDRAFT_602850, partial [Laetiporus sulphureus 93-53]
MPPRPLSKSSSTSFRPTNDAATYRDLLLFEERLKTNAATLTRRKHRYQLFLGQLLLIIAFLLSEVLLQTNLLAIPYAYVLCWALPEVYQPDTVVRVHPYFASGLLCVAVTTLVLFFASGMYAEKIGYANRYVPHANRALRNLNMYLNVRQPPLKLPFNPLALLFPRPRDPPPPSRTSSAASVRRRSPSPNAPNKRSTSVPIPPIPPASNPRGELIFSSRVERGFRESYERYRAAFERRREERERAAFGQTWVGWVWLKVRWVRKGAVAAKASVGTPGRGSPMPLRAGRRAP